MEAEGARTAVRNHQGREHHDGELVAHDAGHGSVWWGDPESVW
ncbi:hypothetical protein [Streptomyces sp. NPDC088139]